MHKDQLYVIGGMDDNYKPVSTVEVYNFASQVWSTLPAKMAVPRFGAAAVICKEKLHVLLFFFSFLVGRSSPFSVHLFPTLMWGTRASFPPSQVRCRGML